MNKKPIVLYVDDEPMNLTVFEAAMPEEWTIHVFDSPIKAIDQIAKLKPWVVVSDQKMPGMVGVKFLEIVKKEHPTAKRVLVTGYSEEDLVVDSIRKAGVHDYIRKPWDVDDLSHRIEQMVNTYRLEYELEINNQALEFHNQELKALTIEIAAARDMEKGLRQELEAWAPPFILSALGNSDTAFPMTRDLALINYDIINGSKAHDVFVDGKSVRALLIREFSELVIKNGGYRESHSGDSAYAHFGLLKGNDSPVKSAMAVADEFAAFLHDLCTKNKIEIECGIGLHVAKGITVNLHVAEYSTPNGLLVQKSFDTSSIEIDLLHRIENLVHKLPGSNISMSENFVKEFGASSSFIELGTFLLKGQSVPTKIFLKPSILVKDIDLIKLRELAIDQAPKKIA